MDSLTYSAAVPNAAVAYQHASDTVVVFGVGHFVYLNVDIHFVVGEKLTQQVFHFSHELFAFVGEFVIFYVVGDGHSFGRAKLRELNGLNKLS